MAGKKGGVERAAGSSVDAMIARFQAYEAMSDEERREFVRKATSSAAKAHLTDEDVAMMMGADGYFQNEDGEFE